MNQTTMFPTQTEAERKFQEFHKKNPEVYSTLVSLARQAKSRGRTKIGINMLIEVFRWNKLIKTTDKDYKINNNYAPRYARMMMQDHPELEGLFNVREMKS